MKLKINKIALEPSQWGGQDLLIKMVTLFDNDGKYVKHIKLDERAKAALEKVEVEIDHYEDEETSEGYTS
jgi:hypothetical protein|tara:strand:- start:355 stop:564 length:210 start_codon:yes stop_codon:yes gene_type:complete